MAGIHPTSRSGLTLIELAIAILVLFVGITASVSMVLTGLKWGYDIRDNTLAVETARTALADATVIDETATNRDASVSGFVNGFWVVREVAPAALDVAPKDPSKLSGHFEHVRVQVYSDVRDGNVAEGKLLWDIGFDRYEPEAPMDPATR